MEEPGIRPKRRFFCIDDDEVEVQQVALEPGHDGAERKGSINDQNRAEHKHNESRPSEHSDFETFLAIVGESGSSNNLETLFEAATGNVEQAVNLYFDQRAKASSKSVSESRPVSKTAKQQPPTSTETWVKGKRFLGSFGIEAWSYTSGRDLLKAGEVVKLQRQNLPTNAPSKKKQSQQLNNFLSLRQSTKSSSKRNSVLLRFSNAAGNEIGRLPSDTARMICSLIDMDICTFNATCIYAPAVLKTGENVLLQLDVYFHQKAFQTYKVSDQLENKSLAVVDDLEMEVRLRDRKIALLKLFELTALLPVMASTVSSRDARSSILEASSVLPPEASSAASQPKSQSKSPSDSDAEDEDTEGNVKDDQLDMLYRKAQMYDINMARAEPSSTFTYNLNPYQKQALHWMKSKELKLENDARRSEALHPLWEAYEWPQSTSDLKPDHSDRFFYNPFSGELSLQFPKAADDIQGGILADEMGLGKTIEMLSLIHSNRLPIEESTLAENAFDEIKDAQIVSKANKATLIVVPMSILQQWKSEAENSAVEGSLNILVYYGSDKAIDLKRQCTGKTGYDLVITSYGVVRAEWTSAVLNSGDFSDHKGLFGVDFFRLILDEGHTIKNRLSKTMRACCALQASRRWVLTGTPIVNRLEDLYSLVRFIGVEPWGTFSFWRTFITVPFENKEMIKALDVVQSVLEPLVLRRTKDTKDANGEQILILPKKTVNIEYLDFSSEEREVYDFISARARRTFQANQMAGTVFKNYTTILSMLLRLRQSCCHISLVKATNSDDDLEEANRDDELARDLDLDSLIEKFKTSKREKDVKSDYGFHVVQQILQEAEQECPLCSNEPMEAEAVSLPCFHMACKKCILSHIEYQRKKGQVPVCHTCRAPVDESRIYEVRRETAADGEKIVTLRRNSAGSSVKLEALIQQLQALRLSEPRTKTVVFSQFTSYLNIVEMELQREKISYVRLDGTMDQKKRAAALRQFESHSGSMVFLLSLKAGGVGLNLIAASRVYLLGENY